MFALVGDANCILKKLEDEMFENSMNGLGQQMSQQAYYDQTMRRQAYYDQTMRNQQQMGTQGVASIGQPISQSRESSEPTVNTLLLLTKDEGE